MLIEKQRYNSLNGLILCNSCGHLLGIVKSLKGFRFAFICKCGELHVQKHMEESIKCGDSANVVCRENHYYCGVCEKEIFYINNDNVVNLAFTAQCKCGSICTNQKTINSVDRNLKTKV